ncbi:VPLPA-CTERM sorting domain-containing protein [Palleronia sp. LCG004]|uniref:VPLPA-CTERM sorting domain-containing protein n=1 Tax=Palleronia sp. LCG004 TaxID=3079304 RepID=UPI0029420320|nr:VPLPA-CTERM sorting domain-containing protein [Palleronia sp. LCG004]WOI56509.1 VPLPA-CTERM sorting domain-containing protein [Palleronia sp. LCG004]
MLIKKLAAAAAISVAAISSANAMTVVNYEPASFSAGQAGGAFARATAFEDFDGAFVFFEATEALRSSTSITINPFNASAGDPSANTIDLSYALNDGERMSLGIDPSGNRTGSSELDFNLGAGDRLSFFLNGMAGSGGNQVTFQTTTAAIPLPAAGLLYVAGIGGVIAMRRKRKASKA